MISTKNIVALISNTRFSLMSVKRVIYLKFYLCSFGFLNHNHFLSHILHWSAFLDVDWISHVQSLLLLLLLVLILLLLLLLLPSHSLLMERCHDLGPGQFLVASCGCRFTSWWCAAMKGCWTIDMIAMVLMVSTIYLRTDWRAILWHAHVLLLRSR